MKKYYLCLILMFGLLFSLEAKTITVTTGYGYFTNSTGNITDKAILPIGIHPVSAEYNYTEVPSKAALDAVVVYEKPMSEARKLEVLIQEKIRAMAIAELTKEGKIK